MNYNGRYANDSKAAYRLGASVVQMINPILKNDYIILQTENMDNQLAKLLDTLSGIDAIMFNKNGISGVGLRVQQIKDKFGRYVAYHTFTIRYSRSTGAETEYAKRKRQIYNAEPSFYPHYTLQAYLDGENKLISAAFCKTKSIFDAAIKYEPFDKKASVYLQTAKVDGNKFLVIPYSEIQPIIVLGKSYKKDDYKIKLFGQQLTINYKTPTP